MLCIHHWARRIKIKICSNNNKITTLWTWMGKISSPSFPVVVCDYVLHARSRNLFPAPSGAGRNTPGAFSR